jgi:hypothetical protein
MRYPPTADIRRDWIIAHHVTALSFHMEIFLPASPNATQEPHSGALAFFPSSKRLIDYWPTEVTTRIRSFASTSEGHARSSLPHRAPAAVPTVLFASYNSAKISSVSTPKMAMNLGSMSNTRSKNS